MIDSGWLATLAGLRQAQFDLKLPFTIAFSGASEKSTQRLVCQKLLRLIPGKRMVCAALWGTRAVVVKLFLDHHKAERHFKRELVGVQALIKAGVETPGLLFFGSVFSGHLPLIIFTEIRSASTLVDLWFAPTKAWTRPRLLKRVCETIAGHHLAGLLQSDIHWSNFLFTDKLIYTIDGDAVEDSSAGTEIGREASFANLALFLAESYPEIDDYLELCWRGYCQNRGWLVAAGDVERLKSLIGKHRCRKVDKFVVKSLRSCTAFVAQQRSGFHTLLDRSYQGGVLDALLSRPDEMMAQGEILKAGNSATVVRFKIEGLDLVVKRYNIKNFRHALRRCLRPSRAFVSWKMGQRLHWWQIATPKPVAMLEKRTYGLRSTAYFITEYVAGSSAYDCLRRPDLSESELKNWLQQFATMLKQLQNLGLSHGDFKATNFLCGADLKLYLLDLDAMRYWPDSSARFKKVVTRDYQRLLANWHDTPELERSFKKMIDKL